MGVSAQARKDQCIARGIVPGATVQLEAVVNGTTKRQTTRIEDVTDEAVAVLVAIEQLRARPLASGVKVVGAYVHREQPWTFTSEVIGHSEDGMCDLLALPDDAASGERRRFFRLPMVLPIQHIRRILPPTEHLDEQMGPEFDATILDLSEGGLQLSTRTPVHTGDSLEMKTALPGSGIISGRLKVVRAQAPTPHRRNYRAACRMIKIGWESRDTIAKYLMSRQLEMRRRGQL